MFNKNFGTKLLTGLLCAALLLPSVPMRVNAANLPVTDTTAVSTTVNTAIVFLQADRAMVNVGESVNFTIRTTETANYVFAVVNGVRHPAAMVHTEPTGQRVWRLGVTPTFSQPVVIHANSSDSIYGAAAAAMPIIVNTITRPVFNQLPAVVPHRIYSIAEAPATARNAVTLTVITDAYANYSWVQVEGNRYIRGTMVNQTATQRTWEITYRPSRMTVHTVQVNANHAYVLDNRVVYQNFQVNLTAPWVRPVNPQITSAQARNTNLVAGDSTTISVRTNADVNYVWALVDGRRANGRRSGAANLTARNWTITVRPNRTGTVEVLANYENSVDGADTRAIRFDVNDAVAAIGSVSVNTNRIFVGESVEITVRTNLDTEQVWAIVDNRRVNARRTGNTRHSERTWIFDVSPERSQTVRVYANTTNRDRDADTRTIRIDVVQDNVIIRSADARWVNDRIEVAVVTNRAAQWVDISIPGRSTSMALRDSRNIGNNETEWTIAYNPSAGWNEVPIRVFAGDSRGGREAARVINHISQGSGNNQDGGHENIRDAIISVFSPSIRTVGGGNFEAIFNITTTADVEEIFIRALDTGNMSDRATSNRGFINAGANLREWTVAVPVHGSTSETSTRFEIETTGRGVLLPGGRHVTTQIDLRG